MLGCHLISDLHFEEPPAVGLEVAVVDLTHGVHILISYLLGNRPLIGQQELVEESRVGT